MIIKTIIILIILIIATIEDLKYREVSNLASLFILIISLYQFNITNIIGLIIAPIPLIITNIIKENSFGGADIKIISCLGLCYGAIKSISILFIALLICFIVNIIKKQNNRAFMPYILTGFIIMKISNKI